MLYAPTSTAGRLSNRLCPLPSCMPQRFREPPRGRGRSRVRTGAKTSEQGDATRLCRDPSSRWSRSYGRPGQRTRQQGEAPCGLGRSRGWRGPQTITYVASLFAEARCFAHPPAYVCVWNLEAGKPGTSRACWVSVQSGIARQTSGVELVALDADWQECQVDSRESGEKTPRFNNT